MQRRRRKEKRDSLDRTIERLIKEEVRMPSSVQIAPCTGLQAPEAVVYGTGPVSNEAVVAMTVLVVVMLAKKRVVSLAEPTAIRNLLPVLSQGLHSAVHPVSGAKKVPLLVESLDAAKSRLAIAALLALVLILEMILRTNLHRFNNEIIAQRHLQQGAEAAYEEPASAATGSLLQEGSKATQREAACP